MPSCFRETGYLYRLFSHRFLCIFVIITTSLTLLQCWLCSRSLTINHNGAKLLLNIIFSMEHPEALKSKVLPLRTAIQKARNGSTVDGSMANSTSFILDNKLVTLNSECIQELKKPLLNLDRNYRTNIATVVFQPWVWGLGMWALILESVPHLAAVWVADIIITVFGALDLHETNLLHEYFHQVVINHCGGIDVLPMYWADVLRLDSAAVVFAVLGLLATSYVSYKLYSVLDWRTFKRLGAGRTVRVAHSFSLAFTVTLHLNAYFIVVFLSLWLDELIIHVWDPNEQSNHLHRTGSWSLNNENIIGIFLLASKDSHVMTENWIFLKFTGVTACVLLFASLIFAIICFVTFDRGLLLQAHTDSRELGEDLAKPNMSDVSGCVQFPSNKVPPVSYHADSRQKYVTGYSNRLGSPSGLENSFYHGEHTLHNTCNVVTDPQLQIPSKVDPRTYSSSRMKARKSSMSIFPRRKQDYLKSPPIDASIQ
ncbi:uncharacterized protein MELLADRAFT_85277 [Melampsora larici-populina 98AG31]|uniref:Uncharacterized protein n=1 Tax=Melampsora larici-populina (strain 98AG31 / pathotype 3-4-7) TaxID=747676 RepID=F4RI67_MELLP|nr:uncharacterized protein MELLADRAFT_85277 [Melampsora larici-populina 98AG31]EGG07950.1 hypothetical protein MELLADRAFT_85277 [Melampsora larici-populina 98AG31]